MTAARRWPTPRGKRPLRLRSQHPHGGQRIRGRLPCTSAIIRCDPDGSNLELVAWGLRNPYGLAFDRGGRLLAVDLGMNDRGSRPIGNAPSCVYNIVSGAWYGWPDFAAALPVTHQDLMPSNGISPRFLLSNHQELGPVQEPLIRFRPREAPTRIASIPNTDEWIVTLFGDKRPVTAPAGPKEGRRLVRMHLSDRCVYPVSGPRFLRPIDVAFNVRDHSFYVVDFGEFELQLGGAVSAKAATGVLWCLPQ